MRQIIEEEEFRCCVERLGGSARIDQALDALMEPLSRYPEGFMSVQSGLGLVYYAITKRITIGNDTIEPLIVNFVIDDEGTVRLRWIEKYDPYL